jgi:hypothetical protein
MDQQEYVSAFRLKKAEEEDGFSDSLINFTIEIGPWPGGDKTIKPQPGNDF